MGSVFHEISKFKWFSLHSMTIFGVGRISFWKNGWPRGMGWMGGEPILDNQIQSG